MKFDSMLAWKQASAAVKSNRDVLLAIAGVCFLLPSLVLQLFFPQPEPNAGMSEQAIMELASNYYLSLIPVLIPILVLQALGTLSLVELLTDRSRPTVGEAMKTGARSIVTYLLAQLILGLFVGIVGGLILAIFSLASVPALASLGLAVVFALVAVVVVRSSVTAPVIVADRLRNPIEALRRAFAVTRGHGLRLFVFYLLVFIAFMVIAIVLGLIVGIPVNLLGSAETARVVTAIVSSTVNALLALYFVAIVVAVHRQLSAESA
ncbi:hypothetical protein [Novosphingobium aquimarinum]|uniref:hypothetical protein n=1 Tax=Novosphingobium aquimarinum TaxID=2682494 RepID=UPI0012EBA2E7|nr:hypothetical protein [Novosphingobium aquimarinum]